MAILSDLKTMTAQREFVEVWILFILAFLAYDVYIGYTQGAGWLLYVKWELIALFFIAWLLGLFFKTAQGDAVACIAVMVLLSPPFILLFLLTLKILSMIFSPFLIFGFGDKKGYPFMPVGIICNTDNLIRCTVCHRVDTGTCLSPFLYEEI